MSGTVGYDMNIKEKRMYKDESNSGSDIKGNEEYTTKSDVPLSKRDDDDDELNEITYKKRMIK